jgi:uncharacterized membrane protein
MWAAVLVGAFGCWLLKVAGLSVPERVLEHPRVERIANLLPVALLAALIATQTFTRDGNLTIDARAAGMVVAAIAVARRAPFLVVLVLAVATTAAVRWLASM